MARSGNVNETTTTTRAEKSRNFFNKFYSQNDDDVDEEGRML